MALTLEQLLAAVTKQAPDLDVRIVRGTGVRVAQFASLLQAKTDDIAFLASAKYAPQLAHTLASAVVLNAPTWDAQQSDVAVQGVIVTSNPYAFFAFASQALEAVKRDMHNAPAPASMHDIHPTAIVHLSVKFGTNVSIGPYTVVEANAVIADNCQIGAHCVIGAGSSIGEASHLYSHVSVYHGTQMGARCIIHSGTVIGSDGFGFAPYQKHWVKIPQTGTVCIGDDVEIGSNCSIDRGALGDTVIGRGTKLDNLIQIAHNVQVGEDCAFAANIAIAGSAIIGNRVQMGGKAGVLGHLSVCDDTVISSCTLVTKTISKAGFYTGVYPIQDNAEWEKNAVSLKRLNILREQVKALEKEFKSKA